MKKLATNLISLLLSLSCVWLSAYLLHKIEGTKHEWMQFPITITAFVFGMIFLIVDFIYKPSDIDSK